MPDYFFNVPASSTGKYHPQYSLGDGGLVRHTKAAVAIAHELLNLQQHESFSNTDKDLIIVSLLLHDGLKHGLQESKFTVAAHPTEAAEWIRKQEDLSALVTQKDLDILVAAISSHMGEWNTDFKTKKEILPKPFTDIEKFVHMCDYLASRKYLLFDFAEDYYNPKNYELNDLQPKITEIINLCKTMIANGYDKEALYGIIASKNDGKKNPNSINDVSMAQGIINELNRVNCEK